MSEASSQSFLNLLKTVSSLEEFKLQPDQIAPVYHEAIQLPLFLTNHLKAKHRRVKQFSGEDAIIQAFYFNMMKLAFEIETEGKNYGQLLRQLLIGDAEFGVGELQDKTLSDRQYRLFLKQFMDVLEEGQMGNFEQTIKYYPIINQILLKMFRQIVPLTLLLRDDNDQAIAHRVLSYLASKFQISLQVISGCFKFVESDIFVYVSTAKMVYLVFVDQLADIKEVTEEEASQASFVERGLQRSRVQSSRKSISSQNPPKTTGKNFQTVINILDSNKLVASKYSNSEKRSSFESGGIRKLKQNIESAYQEQEQEYYGLQKNEAPSRQSQIQSARSKKAAGSKQMSNSSSNYCNFQVSSQSSKQSKDAFSKASQKVVYSSKQKSVGVAPSSIQSQYNKYSSMIFSHSKPSKPALSVLKCDEVKEALDDSSMDKFTDSVVLGVLDEQYRDEIRKIKKRYRMERNNLKSYL